jgi:hypothetical protein
LVSAVQDTLLYSVDTARVKGSSITITDETSLGPLAADRSLYEVTGKYLLSSTKPYYDWTSWHTNNNYSC